MNIKRQQSGFTLIELMITVAVIGILSSIAYPSYQEFIAKSRRAQAKATVAMAQQWMERFYSENFSYYAVRGTSKTIADAFPENLKKSPNENEGTTQYSISIAVAANSPESFTLTATRNTAGNMKSDVCGDLSIDQYGRKTVKNFSTTKFQNEKKAVDYCWQ